MKIFGLERKEFAEKTKVMAANQSLYNGFLIAGLIWLISIHILNTTLFFLICVLIASIYEAFSTQQKAFCTLLCKFQQFWS